MTVRVPESTGDENQKLFTVTELANLLRVAPATIYRYVERRQISFISLPRGLRFRQNDVQEFINRHHVERTQ